MITIAKWLWFLWGFCWRALCWSWLSWFVTFSLDSAFRTGSFSWEASLSSGYFEVYRIWQSKACLWIASSDSQLPRPSMRNSELDGEQTMEQKTSHRPCFPKPKSCIVSVGAHSTYDGYGQKARQTKTSRRARSMVQDVHRDYQSIVLMPERTVPETANGCHSDSGIGWNSSMVNCLESQLHFIPTWFDDVSSEFTGSGRRLRTHHDHSVSCNSVGDRHSTQSSVIFSDCDSSVKLCRLCNTYYEATPSPEFGRNLRYQDLDIPTKISNVFWKLQLTMSPFVRGNNALDFGSLWPSEQCIGGVLLEACSTSSALVETLCKFVMLCGPLHVLKVLLNLNIIGKNQVFRFVFYA